MAISDFKVGKGVVAQNASTFTSGSFTGQITSTLANGTAPFSITSSTLNTNLNADLLDGNHASAFATSAHTHVVADISNLGAGVGAFLVTPTSDNLRTAVATSSVGTGALVFGTSPAITTSLTTPSTTFSLINTTATTVNFAGAATTLSIGAGSGTTTVNNNLTVTGNLTVNGTTTTVNSTIVTVDDIMLMIGGDTAPASDDNLDRGVQFRWHNGTTAKLGFFGYDDSTGYFAFVPDATDTAGVISGTVGTFDGNLTGTAGSATNVTGGSAGAILYQSAAGTTAKNLTIGANNYVLTSDGSIPVWTANTGTGNVVRATSPSLTTPSLGVATATSINSLALTSLSTGWKISGGTTAVEVSFLGGAAYSISGTNTAAYVLPSASATLAANNQTFFIGTTSVAINRASAPLSLTGVSIDGSAGSVANSQTIKFDTGTTEGTDLYTFNGSAAKTIDIKAGTGITLSKTSGAITINGTSGFANPMTTLGDIIYGGASGVATRLAGNTSTTRKFLRQVGDSTNSAAPVWDDVTKTDVGLSNVENTALSTWAGSTNLVTVGAVTVDTGAKLDYNAVTISANTATTIHSFAGATYRSAKFLVQLTQGTKYRVSEVVVLHDGTTAYAAEYGIIEAGGTMSGVAIDATYSAGTINLTATVTDASTTNVAAKAFEIAVVV